jgi:hypothetical protein
MRLSIVPLSEQAAKKSSSKAVQGRPRLKAQAVFGFMLNRYSDQNYKTLKKACCCADQNRAKMSHSLSKPYVLAGMLAYYFLKRNICTSLHMLVWPLS